MGFHPAEQITGREAYEVCNGGLSHEAAEKLSWNNVDTVMVDSSVRAHPTAAKLKKTDKRRCLGRSRGGLGTKIHASNNQEDCR